MSKASVVSVRVSKIPETPGQPPAPSGIEPSDLTPLDDRIVAFIEQIVQQRVEAEVSRVLELKRSPDSGPLEGQPPAKRVKKE